jgi:hypothetical protein
VLCWRRGTSVANQRRYQTGTHEAESEPHNSDVEADVALGARFALPSGPRSLTPVVRQTRRNMRAPHKWTACRSAIVHIEDERQSGLYVSRKSSDRFERAAEATTPGTSTEVVVCEALG